MNQLQSRQPLQWTHLVVPLAADLTIDGDVITWPDPLRYKRYRERTAPPDLLLRFFELRDKSEGAFLRFAQTYGCLSLCVDHELPCSHYWDCSPSGREPVEKWRQFSKAVHAMLQIRDALTEGRVPESADWQSALGIAREFTGPLSWATFKLRSIRDLRRVKKLGYVELGHCVQTWLESVNIMPVALWDQEHNEYQLQLGPADRGYPNLFAHLSWELMREVCGIQRIGICSACKQPYSLGRRRPSKGRKNFCRECGRTAAVRLATQRWRESKYIVSEKEDRHGEKKRPE